MPDFKLPDELLNKLDACIDQVDTSYWTIGDICRDLIDEIPVCYVTRGALRAMVGRGKLAPETVRDLERMSRKVPEAKRRQYEGLSRHQLRACLAAGDAWEEYAAWALESADDYGGKPATVAAIRARVRGEDAEIPGWIKRWERLVDIAGDIAESDAPEWMRNECARLVNCGGAE